MDKKLLPLLYLSLGLHAKLMVVDVVAAGDWLISVKTGPDLNMSSSVTVAVRAYGTDSVSELVALGSGEDDVYFRPNAVDEFKVGSRIQST